MTFKPDDPRKPYNAYDVLPEDLADEIHNHVRSCTIYCPAVKGANRVDHRARAMEIRRDYRVIMAGRGRDRRRPIKLIAEKHGISRRAVSRIINNSDTLLAPGESTVPEV